MKTPLPAWVRRSPEVAAALDAGRPVVALESTLVTHGLPWPDNRAVAAAAEEAVRQAGAVPATVGLLDGIAVIGLSAGELDRLARERGVFKASRRDVAAAVALGRTAGTTVAATMALAQAAGVRVFATGGIGGAHQRGGVAEPWDVSADLGELARTPMVVVCAGAKSILDVPQTLELLDSLSVPVVGYRADGVPLFTRAGSAGGASCRLDSPEQVAALFRAHAELGGGGVLVAQPLPPEAALDADDADAARDAALAEAASRGVRGAELTPFLLAKVAERTAGRSVAANRALIVANARLAAEVARALAG